MEVRSKEKTSLAKIGWIEKIKGNILKKLGYKEGTRFILETKPKIKKYSEIELMRISSIEERLKKAIECNKSGQSNQSGIQEREANILLEWIVQNAREGLLKTKDEDILDASLVGFCGLGQGITATTLKNMGLSPYIVNSESIFSKSEKHGFVVVKIPIQKEEGFQNKLYLIDTTFRQFFLRDEETNLREEYIKDKRFGNRVASRPGYWMLQMKNGELLAKEILENGFVELTEENAKMYGDSFKLSEKVRKKPTRVPKKQELYTGIEGEEYIRSIMDEQMQSEIDYSEDDFKKWDMNTKTPLMAKKERTNYSTTIQLAQEEIRREDKKREG